MAATGTSLEEHIYEKAACMPRPLLPLSSCVLTVHCVTAIA